MDSRLVPPLVWQLLVLLLAGIGAETAWRQGYFATCAVCVIVGLWAGGHALVRTYARRDTDAVTESAWSRAVFQREREARALGAFVDHAPVPLLALRARGSLSALNLAARRFFGTDDLVAEPPEALVPAILGATPGRPQTVMLETRGSTRAYALTVSEIVSDGDMVRVAALVDIQAEIQAAEAAALKELIQVLSHEIMNSLTPVTGCLRVATSCSRTSRTEATRSARSPESSAATTPPAASSSWKKAHAARASPSVSVSAYHEPPAGSITRARCASMTSSDWVLRAIRRENGVDAPSAASKGSTVTASAPPTPAANPATVPRSRFTYGSRPWSTSRGRSRPRKPRRSRS